MNDTMLYRRFMLVAAMIAVMGAFTANVIQQTRTTGNGYHQSNGSQTGRNCLSGLLCDIPVPTLPVA